jgi:branched-chain amino acid transport system substrate-binding protein
VLVKAKSDACSMLEGRRLPLGALLGLLLASGVGAISSATAQETAGTVGAVMPLSGPAATYGQSFTGVVTIAQGALKAEGVALTVITEDGAADVPASIIAYNKLVRIDKVSAIVNAVSPVVLALGPLGERDKVVQINSMAADPLIGKIGPFTFSTMPSYQIEATDAARFAYAKGARKAFVIYQDTAAGKAAVDVFKPAFQTLGGTVLGEEGYKAGATDYRAQLTRAMSEKPDWIYLASYAAETGRILAQAQRMGLAGKVKLIGNVAASQPETVELGGAGAEGFIHASWPFDPENGSAAMKKFAADYKADNGGATPSVYAATSYDALMVLGRAFKSGAKTAPEIQAYLSKIGKVDGVTGLWHFDPQGQVVLKTRFVQIKDGKRVALAD